MRYLSSISLAVIVLMALACTATPDIEATVEARLAQERAIEATVEAWVKVREEQASEPTATPWVVRVTAEPTATPWIVRVTAVPTITPTPKPKPTATRVRPTWTPVPIRKPTSTPNPAYHHFEKGKVHHANDEYQLAIAAFTNAIELDPNNIDLYRWRGASYFYSFEYRDAIPDFTTVIESFPQSYSPKDKAEVYRYRGISNGQTSGGTRQLDDFNSAVKIDPSYALGYNGLGYYYRGNRDTRDKALSYLNKAIELDSKLARAYYNRGNVYSSMADDLPVDKSMVWDSAMNCPCKPSPLFESYKDKGDADQAEACYLAEAYCPGRYKLSTIFQ